MKLSILLASLICTIVTLSAQSSARHTLEVDKRIRSYLLHSPKNLPLSKSVPLVFVFHGGGGDGAGAERLTGFSSLADRQGFLVVYPDGAAGHWNDGRKIALPEAYRVETDDVTFVKAIISDLSSAYVLDPKRIYAAGICNGGMFVNYLAARLSEHIAAIASVEGGITEPFAEDFKPQTPVSILMIQGTSDPMVPYHGGGLLKGLKGYIVDTDKAVKMWCNADRCDTEPVMGDLPDANPSDHCHVHWSRWSNQRLGIDVVLYTIDGGGDTWPGGPQFLPASIIGRVCRAFDAAPTIWDFFNKHPKP